MISEKGANPDEVAITTQNAGNTNSKTNAENKDRDNKVHFLYTESNAPGLAPYSDINSSVTVF